MNPSMRGAKLRAAIIGTGARGGYMYGPLFQGLRQEVELVALWGRSPDSAERMGRRLGVPFYTDIDRLVREEAPHLGVVCVGRPGNGEVALGALEAGLHLLLETPVAETIAEAEAIIRTAAARGLKVEVAEQFHRRPMEAIKLKLLESGVFGEVYSAFNDFGGHGYHGVSLLRSYLGFDLMPESVTALSGEHTPTPTHAKITGRTEVRSERIDHALIRFPGGKSGVYHWSSIGYDSPLRWWRSSRFIAEKGMGVSIGNELTMEHHLTLLSSERTGPAAITVRREWERVDGGALQAVHAYLPNGEGRISWENPFYHGRLGSSPQWHDDEIGVAGCIMSLVKAIRENGEPSYGAEQGKLDQQIVLAIERSAASGGAPVDLSEVR